jgi:mannosyl-oligosaccharide alpha-1,2-mannosidase
MVLCSEWGWEIFESFEKYTKLPEGGFFALKDSTVDPPIRDDRMDTFFMVIYIYIYIEGHY